jgi:mycothiol system anti-sigma-R factor
MSRIDDMECINTYKYICAYLDKELDLETSEYMEKHLKSCPICRNELELQQTMKEKVQECLHKIKAPEQLRKRIIFELSRADEYRESGIQSLDLIRWGTHLAQLYNTKDDLIEVLVPYIQKGLEQNELCLWVTSEMSEHEISGSISDEIPNIQEYIKNGQLQIMDYESWYLSNGCFDRKCALDGSFKKYNEALSGGYSGLRIAGTVSWVDESDWNSFMEYENYINKIVGDYKILILCTYKEDKCDIDKMLEVIKSHECVLSKMDDMWRQRETEAM